MMTETVEDVKLDEKISITAELPPKYKVIMLNDNATPMDFVTSILCLVFKHTDEKLTNCFDAIEGGVQEVRIGQMELLNQTIPHTKIQL